MLELMHTENLALRPNCLLTQSALAFVSGTRSLFSPRKMAADLQDFLSAHGYQMASLWMPFRSPKKRQESLSRWFKAQGTNKFHFVMALETWTEFKTIFMQNQESIVSINLIVFNDEGKLDSSESRQNSFLVNKLEFLKIPVSYHLHQAYCFLFQRKAIAFEKTLLAMDPIIFDRFLDHCIELAENEFT